MGKMKNLYSEGVTDLFSYEQGQRDKQERIIRLIEDLIDKKSNAKKGIPLANSLMTEVAIRTMKQLIALIKGNATDSASSTLPISQEEMKTFHCSKCPMTVKVLGDYADLYLRCPNCTSVLIKGEK